MSDAPTLDIPAVDAVRATIPGGLWAVLSHREQLFVAALLAHPKMEQKAAAIAAGYPKRSAKQIGHELAHRPHVKAAIACAQAKRIERTLVDADFVVTQTVEVLNGAKEDREWSAANGSLTLLGKHLGMFVEKDATPDDEATRAAKIRAALEEMDARTIAGAA